MTTGHVAHPEYERAVAYIESIPKKKPKKRAYAQALLNYIWRGPTSAGRPKPPKGLKGEIVEHVDRKLEEIFTYEYPDNAFAPKPKKLHSHQPKH